MSDTSAADSYLESELETLVGQFSSAIPGAKTPTQAQIAGGVNATEIDPNNPTTTAYANEASNVGLLQQLNNIPDSSAADILKVASGYANYSDLDPAGQQILQQIAHVNQLWANSTTSTPDTFSYQAPPASTIPATPDPASTVAFDQNAWTDLTTTLNQYGLGSLSNFVKQELTQGVPEAQVSLDLMQQQAFKDRFPAIAQRQAAGLPSISPGDYINLENSYTQILQESGMPAGFYDTPQALSSLVAADVSPAELQTRIQQGYDVVANAPPEVQAAFSHMFGPSGAAALAAYTMDPTVAEPALLQQVQAAQIAGVGTDYGFGLTTAQAMRLSQMGVSTDQAKSNFQTGAQDQSLIHGAAGDSDIFGQDNLVAGLFGTDPGSTFDLNQAVAEKQADFAGAGSAAVETTGATGLGAARSI